MSKAAKIDQEFDALMDVLDQVKLALKTGKYVGLDESLGEQNNLIAVLENRPNDTCLTEHQAKRLAQSARHNQRLIKATLAGLQSARRRKENVAEAQKNSLTYDQAGNRHRLTGVKVTLEKRR